MFDRKRQFAAYLGFAVILGGCSGEKLPDVAQGVSAPDVQSEREPRYLRIVEPRDGAVVDGEFATVVGRFHISLQSVEVNAIQAQVSGGQFRVANVPLAIGENRIVARGLAEDGRVFEDIRTIRRKEPAQTPLVSRVEERPTTAGINGEFLRWISPERQDLIRFVLSDPVWPQASTFLRTMTNSRSLSFWNQAVQRDPYSVERTKDAMVDLLLQNEIETWIRGALHLYVASAATSQKPRIGEGLIFATTDLWPSVVEESQRGYLPKIVRLGTETFRTGLHAGMLMVLSKAEKTNRSSDYVRNVAKLLGDPSTVTAAVWISEKESRSRFIGEILAETDFRGPVFREFLKLGEREFRALVHSVRSLVATKHSEVAVLESLFTLLANHYPLEKDVSVSKTLRPLISSGGERSYFERMMMALDRGHRRIQCPGGFGFESASKFFLTELAQSGSVAQGMGWKGWAMRKFCGIPDDESNEWAALARDAQNASVSALIPFIRSLAKNGEIEKFLNINRKLVESGTYVALRSILSKSVESDLFHRYVVTLKKVPNGPRVLADLVRMLLEPNEDGRSVAESLIENFHSVMQGDTELISAPLLPLIALFRRDPASASEFLLAFADVAQDRGHAKLSKALFDRWRVVVGGRFASEFVTANQKGTLVSWLRTGLEHGRFDPAINLIEAMALHDRVSGEILGSPFLPTFVRLLLTDHIAAGRPLHQVAIHLDRDPRRDDLMRQTLDVLLDWARSAPAPFPWVRPGVPL